MRERVLRILTRGWAAAAAADTASVQPTCFLQPPCFLRATRAGQRAWRQSVDTSAVGARRLQRGRIGAHSPQNAGLATCAAPDDPGALGLTSWEHAPASAVTAIPCIR